MILDRQGDTILTLVSQSDVVKYQNPESSYMAYIKFFFNISFPQICYILIEKPNHIKKFFSITSKEENYKICSYLLFVVSVWYISVDLHSKLLHNFLNCLGHK